MTERFQAGMTRGNVIRCEAPVDLLGPGALRGHFQADGGTGLEWMNDQLQFCGLLASQIISRSLLRSCQTLAAPKERAQRTTHYRFAIAANVFFVHRRSGRLSRFRLHGDLRPQ